MKKVQIQVVDALECIKALSALGISATRVETDGCDEIKVDYNPENNILEKWLLESGWDKEDADYILNGD